jgi:hypothetical protein
LAARTRIAPAGRPGIFMIPALLHAGGGAKPESQFSQSCLPKIDSDKSMVTRALSRTVPVQTWADSDSSDARVTRPLVESILSPRLGRDTLSSTSVLVCTTLRLAKGGLVPACVRWPVPGQGVITLLRERFTSIIIFDPSRRERLGKRLILETASAMASAAVFSDEEVIVDAIPETRHIPNDADIEGELRSMAVQDETENGAEGTHHAPECSDGSQIQNDSMPISPSEESKSKGGYFSFLKKLPSFKSKKNGPTKEDEVVKKLAAKISACRHSLANADGGLKNTDHEGIRISRSVVTEIVKQVQEYILSLIACTLNQ